MLADVKIQVETSRLLIWRATVDAERGSRSQW